MVLVGSIDMKVPVRWCLGGQVVASLWVSGQ